MNHSTHNLIYIKQAQTSPLTISNLNSTKALCYITYTRKKEKMASQKLVMALSVLLLISLISVDAQGLRLGYYKYACPKAEYIVEKTTTDLINKAPTLAAALLRMHFHDCFVRVHP